MKVNYNLGFLVLKIFVLLMLLGGVLYMAVQFRQNAVLPEVFNAEGPAAK